MGYVVNVLGCQDDFDEEDFDEEDLKNVIIDAQFDHYDFSIKE